MPSLQSLVPTPFYPLSAAEEKLLQNAGLGTLAVCGPSDNMNDPLNNPDKVANWEAGRSIRGELISWVCADRQARSWVGPGGVQVFGARIIGNLELVSASVEFPLLFACCYFDDRIVLQSARARTLSFTRTHLKSVLRMVPLSREPFSCGSAWPKFSNFQERESRGSLTEQIIHFPVGIDEKQLLPLN